MNDVTASPTNSPCRVGVLSLHNSKETKAILNAVAALGHEPVWLREENLTVYTDGSTVEIDPDIDVIANRLLLTKRERPLEELGIASVLAEHRPMLNPPDAVLTSIHKFATATTLTSAGVPVPPSGLAFDRHTLNRIRERFGRRVVQKTAIGTNGTGVWNVNGETPLAPTVLNNRTMIQRFIETDGDRQRDWRVYVVAGDVVAAMKRYAPRDDWRANVARGGDVEGATSELPAAASRFAKRATAAVGLDYAGVDLMRRDDEWYVIEVNPTAGFKGLFRATGTSPAPYIARAAIERTGRHISPARVDTLDDTLDDSTPACKPEANPLETGGQVLGYTEQVTVSGGRTLKTVIAKADTGASRTSIDLELAGEIGAGPIKSTTQIRAGSQKTSTTRPLVDIAIGIRGNWHTVTASVQDRSHMDHPILIGRDVLGGYQVDIRRRVEE